MSVAAASSTSLPPPPPNPNSLATPPQSDISNPPIMSIGTISIANVAGMVPTKLNRQNFITWRSLFIPVLKRFKLLGLVNGEDLCPPQFIRDSSGSCVLNASFETWCERDQILMIWINSTLSEDLLPLTIGMADSRSLWQSLERRFSGASHISDKLAAAGEPLSESDLVAYILSGLPDEYESFVDSIETRNESVTADELHAPTAMSAMTSSASPSYWLTDSGASHHVTPDPSALNSAIPYSGNDQLFVGDGKGLCISHTGSALIRTKHATFRLNDVLLVPQASRNLLSVYKFVHDNWCSLTFDPFGFYVKDLSTGKMLFQGPSEGGLYPFYWNASNGVSGIAISPTALMIAKADIHIWHRRLGHPSGGILHSVVNKNHLPSPSSLPPQPPPVPVNTHSMLTRAKAGIHKPKMFTATKHILPSTVDSLTALPPTPSTFLQASKSSHWMDAMQSEFQALQSTDTFSPVAKPTTIRILLSIAVTYDWFVHQLDVSNAFLHGHLKEDVYMIQPPGFVDPSKPHHVCKLRKSLYGLKQAPRACLFIKRDTSITFILVYVDDIIITGSSSTTCQSIISNLQLMFPVKDLGDIHYFLGIEVHKSAKGLLLHQTKYALDLLKKTDMLGAKPCATPVCQYMHSPRTIHLQAVKRILRYLKGTVDSGLWFTKSPQFLTAWSDADWAGCPVDRRSTSGYCVFLGSNLISWSAKKQATVARSSTEAEYRSLAHTAAELTWVCKILHDISFPLLQKPVIYCDNKSAIALAFNPVFHARTKHVEIDYHYIREKVLLGHIGVQHVASLLQIADIFTKPLAVDRFAALTYKLSVRSPSISLRGCYDCSVGLGHWIAVCLEFPPFSWLLGLTRLYFACYWSNGLRLNPVQMTQ
ncbi:hypothetical protein D8674_023517 [Pyrus ussuriensis x Pyrus communis]|uniref:Reverse transcriptase Ty1/copia-type domain-containing protein n=1 Tax=Pyrus ussuriensis x Pyrus communis TaxID=2448454 RepID=A0A5N5H0C9_9ROSA|nr:hypothetical protein D8674_023517 [Pyrus ussuriensis x Pyrus communis]